MSSSTASNNTSELDKFKRDYPKATEQDFKVYKVDKQKLFKGSVVVCVVYGVFALVLLLLTLFVEPARHLLADEFSTFVATLIGGMIMIIVLMIIQIATFKPRALSMPIYDADICPDYWKLVQSDTADLASVSDEDKFLMQYKCIPDETVYNKTAQTFGSTAPIASATTTNIYGQTVVYDASIKPLSPKISIAFSASNGPAFNRYLIASDSNANGKGYAKTMFGDSNNMVCDKVFPNFLAAKDLNDFPEHPNQLRCAYAQKCGIPWTSICPEKESGATNF